MFLLGVKITSQYPSSHLELFSGKFVDTFKYILAQRYIEVTIIRWIV